MAVTNADGDRNNPLNIKIDSSMYHHRLVTCVIYCTVCKDCMQ